MVNKSSRISDRTAIIFYIILSVGIKVFTLPKELNLLTAILGAVFEFLLLALMLFLIRLKISPLINKFLLFIFGAILGLQVWFIIRDLNLFVFNRLFEEFSPIIYFALLGLFFLFIVSSKPQSVFRSAEILWPLLLLGIVVCVAPPSLEITAKLPEFEAFNVLNFIKVLPYFSAPLFLFIFKDNLVRNKGFNKKFILYSIGSLLFFVFFVFLFHNIAGALAETKDIAPLGITVYASYLIQNGEFDFLLISIMLLHLLYCLALVFCAIGWAFRQLFGLENAEPKEYNPKTTNIFKKLWHNKIKILCFVALIVMLPTVGTKPDATQNKLIATTLAFSFEDDEISCAVVALNTNKQGENDEKFKVYDGSGENIDAALKNITENTGKEIALAHCCVLVLNENLGGEKTVQILSEYATKTELANSCAVLKTQSDIKELFKADAKERRLSQIAEHTQEKIKSPINIERYYKDYLADGVLPEFISVGLDNLD
ncbi:MAG: hypothetical protein LBM01_03900 [Christensenellaceae bacterium]|jgi:hypothetical protein|nr:hypothetical protein [Christensenellaceae bacterium]